MTHTTTLHNAQQAHVTLAKLWSWAKPRLIAGQKLTLSIAESKRSTEQNSRMWAMLADVGRQVDWHGQKLVVPGLDGGFVVLGTSTSKMSKAEMGELMDLMEAFGAQQGVRFTAQDEGAPA